MIAVLHDPILTAVLEWPEIEQLLSIRIGQIMSNIESHKRKVVLIGRFSALISILDEIKDELPNIHSNRYIDIILMPQVREILDLPPDKSVTPAAMARLRECLPSIWAQWKREISATIVRRHHFLRPIFTALGTLDHPATLGLDCANCYCSRRALLTYDDLFAHRCHGKNYEPKKSESATSTIKGAVYEHAATIACKRTQWNSDLRAGYQPSRILDLMRACVVDPNRTTWKDMDGLNVDLVCSNCDSRGQAITMNWRTAAS